MQASVKVMRSYDYCHFEVALSVDDAQDLDAVDALRKAAAVLVDEAVRQYKEAKKKERNREAKEWDVEQAMERKKRVEAKPKKEWSLEDAAFMRAVNDKEFWKQYREDDYYYEDPERDHHFSMLRRFQEVKVTP
jgi:hypothetical protein